MTDSRVPVSIGLPVYNGEVLLPGALDCLLGQTYEDFELVISDNASTDTTEQICRDYASRDPRIRYYRQQVNLGASPNFNAVFELSRGKYFKWAAYDDLCAPTFLERCVEVLDDRPEIVWCHSQSTHIDMAGHVIDEPELQRVSYVSSSAESERANLAPTRNSPRPHQRLQAVVLGRGGCLDTYGLIRSDVLRNTLLYRTTYGWEKVFVGELALRGRYYEIPEVLFFPRIHPRQSSVLLTSADQRQWVNPQGKGLPFTRLCLLAGYFRTIVRANLTLGQRLLCVGVVMRYLLQVHKWCSIVARFLSGRGVGGDSADVLQRQSGRAGTLPAANTGSSERVITP